ncbi:MAG: DUF4215 domain-containing protein [Candidatus Omnitrophica bacterium]|nr:DUF4215 domain-containing protein [Candidatus Omnitrophota bacterium]
MKKNLLVVLGLCFTLNAFIFSGIGYSQNDPVGKADGGKDIITYVSIETTFHGIAYHPDREIVGYEWDFDGDGVVDWESIKDGRATYIYQETGEYQAIFQAYDHIGEPLPIDIVNVTVKEGTGQPEYINKERLGIKESTEIIPQTVDDNALISTLSTQQEVLSELNLSAMPIDGIQRRYVLILNGSGEMRFWEDIEYLYAMLLQHNIPPEDIYLFNYNGLNPDNENPGNMIDYAATKENLQMVCNYLAQTVDRDDILYIWIDDHGHGYIGPNQLSSYQQKLHGYLAGEASVDPGDEQDYLESEFKLRSIFVGGDYIGNYGMDTWIVEKRYTSSQSSYKYIRMKYLSHFSGLYFNQNGDYISDNDVYIERVVDYLQGDLNRDGYIQTSLGEIYDYDGDGIQPYDHVSGTFDEDDWGELDYFDDSYNFINSGVPEGGRPYQIFDNGFDNRLDIDLNHDGVNFEIDGTDQDNMGLFDQIDANQDGDYNDWISIDEKIALYGDDLTDDELSLLLDPISARAMVVILEPCFSGGFIEDLSKANRVIFSATEEETYSWGNLFIRNTISAFSGINYLGGTSADPSFADDDGSGHVSMAEAFNFAALNDNYLEVPQYDDNADGIAHPYPIPISGDGHLGSIITLSGNNIGGELPVADAGPNQTVYEEEAVILDGSDSYDNDGSIIDFSWCFGDGQCEEGMVVGHKYQTADTYTAILKIRDDDEFIDTDSCLITVEEGFCGDNIVNEDEECDDGNTVDGDGCSSDCILTDVRIKKIRVWTSDSSTNKKKKVFKEGESIRFNALLKIAADSQREYKFTATGQAHSLSGGDWTIELEPKEVGISEKEAVVFWDYLTPNPGTDSISLGKLTVDIFLEDITESGATRFWITSNKARR